MHAYISNICMNKYISICLIVYIYIYIQKFNICVYTHILISQRFFKNKYSLYWCKIPSSLQNTKIRSFIYLRSN